MWFIPAIISAIILGGTRVYEKKLSSRFGNFSMGFIVKAFSLIPTLILFFFLPLPPDIWHMPWQFWWPLIIIWVGLYPVQTYFLYKSIREGELSRTTPVFALLPVFNILTSYLVIGELPTMIGAMGIILIVVGTYLLLKGNQKESTSSGIYKPVLHMMIAVFCMAIGSTLDKVALQASTPVFYSFMNNFGAMFVFIILMYIYKQNTEFKLIKKELKSFTVLGISQAIAFILFVTAFGMGQTSYVLAVRSGSYILAAIVAIFYFKESFSKKKGVAIALFLIGIILLAF